MSEFVDTKKVLVGVEEAGEESEMLTALRVALMEAEAERDKMHAAQTYTYIGKDGKSVMARDLEDERDALRAELQAAHDSWQSEVECIRKCWAETTAERDALRAEVERLRKNFNSGK